MPNNKLPHGLDWTPPCFTIGTGSDNQLVLCASDTGTNLTIKSVGPSVGGKDILIESDMVAMSNGLAVFGGSSFVKQVLCNDVLSVFNRTSQPPVKYACFSADGTFVEGESLGASGTFTTADAKTVTVVNGIITSIV